MNPAEPRTSGQLRARLTRMLELQAATSRDDTLLRTNTVMAFVHHQPPLTLLLDGRGETLRVAWDTLEPTPDLVFELPDAATAHAFWAGELKVLPALRARQLVMKGNPLRALSLLPSAAASQAAYRAALAEEQAP